MMSEAQEFLNWIESEFNWFISDNVEHYKRNEDTGSVIIDRKNDWMKVSVKSNVSNTTYHYFFGEREDIPCILEELDDLKDKVTSIARSKEFNDGIVLSFDLDKESYDLLCNEAHNRAMSLNDYVIELIEEYLVKSQNLLASN